MSYMLYIYWIFVILSEFIHSEGQQIGDLVQLNIVYRHGARYPIYPFPNSPLINGTPGELMTVGMQQSYQLGQVLKERYIDGHPFCFLSTTYDSKEVLVRSSIVSRAMQSAYCQLAGMYPPSGDQIWHPDLLWQPIPVYTRSVLDDPVTNVIIFGNSIQMCPNLVKYIDDTFTSAQFQQADTENKAFFTYLDKLTGYPRGRTNITNVWTIYDDLDELITAGLAPDWLNNIWHSNQTVKSHLDDLYKLLVHGLYIGGLFNQLLGGPLLEDILNNMHSASHPTTYKAFLYAGHQDKLGPIADCLDVYDHSDVYPIYLSAAMAFELYYEADNHQYSVKTSYRAAVNQSFIYVNIPGCGETCTLKQFEEIVSPCIPGDWKELCQIPEPATSQNEVVIAVVVSVIVICAVLFLIVCSCLIYRKRKLTNNYGSI